MADLHNVADAVRALDYAVLAQVPGGGSAVVGVLAGLLTDPNPEVRLLAVHTLVATADPAAAPVLARALVDENEQVAMAAAQGLRTIGRPPPVGALLGQYGRIGEPMVRAELALFLCEHAQPADIAAIKATWQGETASLARDALAAGLAKLGDPDARAAFTKALLASQDAERRRHLELVDFIGQPWLLQPLGELLDDRRDLVYIGIDGHPELPQSLRACDLALWSIARIAGAAFPLQLRPSYRYTNAELEAGRRFVDAAAP